MCECVFFIFLLIVCPKKGFKVVLKRPKLKVSCRTKKKKSCWSFVNHRLSFVEEIMAMIFTGEEQPQPKFFSSFLFMMKSALHFYRLSSSAIVCTVVFADTLLYLLTLCCIFPCAACFLTVLMPLP